MEENKHHSDKHKRCKNHYRQREIFFKFCTNLQTRSSPLFVHTKVPVYRSHFWQECIQTVHTVRSEVHRRSFRRWELQHFIQDQLWTTTRQYIATDSNQAAQLLQCQQLHYLIGSQCLYSMHPLHNIQNVIPLSKAVWFKRCILNNTGHHAQNIVLGECFIYFLWVKWTNKINGTVNSVFIYTVSQKSSHHLTVSNFAKCEPIFKIFALLESVWNLLQNLDDIIHHICKKFEFLVSSR